MNARLRDREQAPDFAPAMLRMQRRSPSPLPHAVLHALLALFALVLLGTALGRLDIVAVAPGRIVPQSFLKIVQPAEAGIVREILARDGQAVRKGQVLIRMDTRLTDADRSIAENDLRLKELALRRIDAELTGEALRRAPGDSAALFAEVVAQYRAHRQAHEDAIAAESAQLARAREDLEVALEIERKLKKTLPLYREQAEGWARLASEGFAGKLMAMERQRLYIENDQDLRAQTHSIAGLEAVIAQSQKRIAQIRSSYRQQLQNERIETMAQRHRLEQELKKHRHRSELLDLRAPEAGIVKDIGTHTAGTVVAPGTILLTLVPQNEPLIAEVWVSNADVGFVQQGQRTRLKFAAYPFQKYGMLDAVVKHVSADAEQASEEGSAKSKPAHEAAYRTLVAFGARAERGGSSSFRVVPGMLVNAEIHLGTRTILQYLLSPVQKVAHEAGRER